MSYKLFPTVYVGFNGRRSEDSVPLGFMVPDGDDKAAIKRKASVDKWAQHYNQKSFNSVSIENKPMSGFKLGRSVRRSGGWNSTASYVRVEDPRGFELELTMENIVHIAAHATISNGDILQECVWVRTGSKNFLLPTNSPMMAEVMIPDTPLLDINTLTVGDEVLMHDGRKFLWLGEMQCVYVQTHMDSLEIPKQPGVLWNGIKNDVANTAAHVAKTTLVGYSGGTCFDLGDKPKVVKILKKATTPLTDKEVDEMTNVQNGATSRRSSIWMRAYDKINLETVQVAPSDLIAVVTNYTGASALYHYNPIVGLETASNTHKRVCINDNNTVVNWNGTYYRRGTPTLISNFTYFEFIVATITTKSGVESKLAMM